MRPLIVVNNPANWTLKVPGVEVVTARRYLTEPAMADIRHARVINLCRSYRYQSIGYYVSLLAEARGHRPQPSVSTIQDLKSISLVRFYSEELDELIQRNLAPLRSDEFVLSIYFGHNVAKRYDRLALQLFNVFPAPLLRASFARGPKGNWRLQDIVPIGGRDIPESHREFVVESATRFFSRTRRRRKPSQPRYDLAILHDPTDPMPPSDERALSRFVRAARKLGLEAELITRDDFPRLAEFDALLIRETTAVNHHTFRFARRAAAEGLAVIDDPDSILRCTNKVFLAELLEQHEVPAPRTLIVHRDNVDEVAAGVGLPCILKQPDSAFSQGVSKVETLEQLHETIGSLLDRSDLVIAQEFLPTEFDWRIGVLERQALYAARYHMARHHWQIVDASGKQTRFGRVEAVALDQVPRSVLRAGVRAASLIGDGLYGVDVKHVGRRAYVIEINDNPSLDAGLEDAVLGEALYERIVASLVRRIERQRGGSA